MVGTGEQLALSPQNDETEYDAQVLFPGSDALAQRAPETVFDQPYAVAVMLDVRHALAKDRLVQRLTEPFEAYEGQMPGLREAYEALCAARPLFRRMVSQVVQSAGEHVVSCEGPVRVKSPRSNAAKLLLRLAEGNFSPIPDGLGARVSTRGVDPGYFVERLRQRSRLPETLPGGVASVQTTGSAHSVMYRDGCVGHKLAIPIDVGYGVDYAEFLDYDDRDIRMCDLTRAGFEAARRRKLELLVSTPVVTRLEAHYQKTVDRWK